MVPLMIGDRSNKETMNNSLMLSTRDYNNQ